MSKANSRESKRARSIERAARKAAAFIPSHPIVIVGKNVVKDHRYARSHGLPFSETVAKVAIN